MLCTELCCLPAALGCLLRQAGCSVSVSRTTLTCNPPSIPVGGSVTYVVPVTPTQPGTLNTSATVTAPGDPNPSNNGPVTSTIVAVGVLVHDAAA